MSASSADLRFDRPVFLVGAPRSGVSALHDTLMRAPGVFTVRGAAHSVIDAMPALDIRAHGYDSNRLDASDATPATIAEFRSRLADAARDRDGHAPPAGPFRLLDKLPKNALRIPFLARVFPQARFIHYYRDPREVLAQMLLAWQSGQFRTYLALPGWPRAHWSLALTPGWRELKGKPLAEIVAGQWQSATQVLLDDLDGLPPDRWRVVRHADFLANASGEIARLCLALDYDWDRPLDGGVADPAPATAADAAVIRSHAADLQRLWPRMQPLATRAARMAGLDA